MGVIDSVGIMIPEILWITAAAATIPAVMLDVGVRAIQQLQRRSAGVADDPSIGPVARFLLSLILNFAVCFGVAWLYQTLWPGSGRALVYGGVLWLLLAIPVLFMVNYVDEVQKKTLITWLLGWLFKVGATAASLAYFIG